MKDKLGKEKDSPNFKLDRICPKINNKTDYYHFDFSQI